ncbi:MAG: hypothetical protein IPG55_04615 [Saprospiraceae bacterium]|nr:hypothetical protein [Candidatus Defluviibacterium haderslevense]
MAFDHNMSSFPLTGAHKTTDCRECHIKEYKNTPTDCFSCHNKDYNQSTNPNHANLNITTDCISCHTTAPGWAPAKFDIHNQFYVLDNAHADIANDCKACHHGNYKNTPNTCQGCHLSDYNASINPNHKRLNIPTNCVDCHTTVKDWKPATFDIHNNYYVLDGAHASIAHDCNICHHGNYNTTPKTCAGCHITDYNASTNPNHKKLNLSTDCVSCHTTAPNWEPATFDVHNNYYVLQGAHANIKMTAQYVIKEIITRLQILVMVVIKPITIKPLIQIIKPLNSLLIALCVIHKQHGPLLHLIMTPIIFPYIPENIKTNGTYVVNVIPTRMILKYSAV